jgi:hypothetical protein
MIEQGQSVRSLAQALAVAEGQLHKWKRVARQLASPTQHEVLVLRARLKQVEMERDILMSNSSLVLPLPVRFILTSFGNSGGFGTPLGNLSGFRS